MNDKILNKNVIVKDNHIIMTEEVESRLSSVDIEMKMRNIDNQIRRLKEQNERLVAEHNRLSKDRQDLVDLLNQLNISTDIEVIE